MTSAEPFVGVNNPRNSLIAVLLPAPFGPSSPVTPFSTEKFTEFKARVSPYAFVRFWACNNDAMQKVYTTNRRCIRAIFETFRLGF